MKYLLLTPELLATEGGIARILRLYLKGLCDLSGDGDCVRLLSLNDRVMDSAELSRYSNGKLLEWRVCSRSKLAFVRAALRMGMDSDRIVCGHVGQLPVAWLISKLKPKLRYYLVAHGIEVWRPFGFLEKRALKGARRIFCVSEFTRLRLLEHCPLAEGQTAVLYNALDPRFSPASTVSAPGDAPLVLAISRLSIADGYKGIDSLIAAMPAVCAAIPGARLRIVGRGDGLAGLQAAARKLNVEKSVEFAGYRSDRELSGEFNACRLFALPSQREGFGLVYLEAMAHGRPCLGARSGGVPEVITAETGVLVEYGNVTGIADGIVEALRRDWKVGPLLERASMFSYLRFSERLASLLS